MCLVKIVLQALQALHHIVHLHMVVLPKSVEKVIEEFEKLPGIGPKSAARMAYFFLRAPKERSVKLADALVDMKEKTVPCERCFNIADMTPCSICSSPDRNQYSICVVEEPLDVVALERSGVYTGVYFVLGGVISPADGVGPEELRMSELRRRVLSIVTPGSDEDMQSPPDTESIEKRLEVIIATNPSLEGEATASYIVEMLRKISTQEAKELVSISRLAMGLPTGADLEYADRLTLKRALEGRVTIPSQR